MTTNHQAPLSPNEPPLISVIVRSMDRPTLTQALDALRAQTHPHIEVLVVNARIVAVSFVAYGLFTPTTPHWLILLILGIGGFFRSLHLAYCA